MSQGDDQMAETSSFDITATVEKQEVKNAVEQTMKELGQRFDFKGSRAAVTFNEKDSVLQVTADDDYKLKATIDILKGKCVKRHVSLKALSYGKVEQSLGGTVRQQITVQNGIADDQAKAIAKSIKESRLKAQVQIQGDHVRVQSKSKDELQAVIGFLKERDFGIDLQFGNYR